jgi:intraflagellar transport protein 122
VEFEIEEGISEEEVMNLLKQQPSDSEPNIEESRGPKWQEEQSSNYQSLKLDYDYLNIEYNNDYENEMENDPNNDNNVDPFTKNLTTYREGNEELRPVVVNRAALHQMKQSDIIIVDYPYPLIKKYYRNFMPDIQITKCQFCFKVLFNFVVVLN